MSYLHLPTKVTITISILTLACGSAGALVGKVAQSPVRDERTVTATTLNVRAAPDGLILSYLLRGDFVTVYEIDDDWCRITPEQSVERWVYCKWLK